MIWFCYGICLKLISEGYLLVRRYILFKKKQALTADLREKIITLDELHKTTRSIDIKHKLDNLCSKLKLIEATSLAKEVRFAKQQVHEAEPHERLALAEIMIFQNQNTLTFLKDKLKLLSDYYDNLYKSQDSTEESLKEFFIIFKFLF